MEFCYQLMCKRDSVISTHTLLVNSVNKINGDICRSFAMSVNKLMMNVSNSGDSMTTVACYKGRVNVRLATRLITQ